MSTRLRILAALVTAAGSVVALAAASPANADNGVKTQRIEIPKNAKLVSYLVSDRSGTPLRNYSVRTETTSTKQYAVVDVTTDVVFCAAWNSPIPTYSSSNHTMHYGVQAQCDEVIPVRVRMVLWSGPDPDHTNTWQDSTSFSYGTGSAYQTRVRNCIDWGGFAWWELYMYAEGDTNFDGIWEMFAPYPLTSMKENECMDIA